MPTEFDDSQHYGFFMTGTTLTSQTGKYARLSELVLSALRAQGVLDDMEDGTTAPVDTSKLWLDKNTDPAILKEYDSIGSAWVAMTRDRMFGRAIATELANVGGTANAITVDQPDPFIDGRMYFITPTADNTGATTIQVTGVGTYNVLTPNGSAVGSGTMITGNATVMLFTGGAFKVLFSPTLDAALIDGSVTTNKIADGAVTNEKVEATFFEDGTVTLDDNDAVAVPLQDRFGRFVTVEDFGAVSYTEDELVALSGSVGSVPSTNATAFQNALDYVESIGGGFVWALGHIYPLGDSLDIPPGVKLVMAQPGAWDCVFHNRPKTWEGTTLLFKGTLTRDQSFHGVTSMAVAGGWREDPDNAAEYFKLTTFMNTDASGATRATARTFSAAVKGKDPQSPTPWHIQGGRICSWIGTDGISDYSNQVTSEYGDDQDIGVMVLDTDRVTIRDCQVVGYWRIAGMALLNPGHDEYAQMERLLIENCLIQGRCGLLIRGNDVHLIESSTSNSVTIPWTNEHFWESSGSFEGGTLADYTYTGLSYSATGGGQLTFTGVSPDPSGESQIHSLKRGSGVAGSVVRDTHVHSFCHVSGDDYQTATGSSDHDRAIEISGYPMRGLHFYNVKAQVYGPICVFWHDCEDMRWIGGQLETATTTAGHLIASPVEGDASGVDHAAGQTRDMVWEAVNLSHVDERLFQPGSLLDPMRQNFKPFADRHTRIRPRSSGLHVYIEDDDDNVIFSSQEYSWTPTFNFGTSITYTNQEGKYQRIANWIHFTIDMSWSALGTSDTSSIQIQLPVAGQDQDAAIIGSVNSRLSSGLDLSSRGAVHLDPFGTDQVGLTDCSDGGRLAYNGGEIQSSGRLVLTGCYKLLAT